MKFTERDFGIYNCVWRFGFARRVRKIAKPEY